MNKINLYILGLINWICENLTQVLIITSAVLTVVFTIILSFSNLQIFELPAALSFIALLGFLVKYFIVDYQNEEV